MGKPELIVVVDSREKIPYEFPLSQVRTLPTGDYSIVGLEDHIAIERKTKADAYRSLGYARARFQRELERLAALDYAAIVVECSMSDFMVPPPFSQLHSNAALGTLLSWSVRYRVPVFFAGSREQGQWLTQYLLSRYSWYAMQEDSSVGQP